MPKTFYALSIKQPWAALIVHGLKTIEVRSWPTRRRGLILIHAAQHVDPRRHGWLALDERAGATAELRGGIIGQVRLVDCLTYHERAGFARDRRLHLNHPDWFQPPRLHGFYFTEPRIVPFRPLRGLVRFFRVSR